MWGRYPSIFSFTCCWVKQETLRTVYRSPVLYLCSDSSFLLLVFRFVWAVHVFFSFQKADELLNRGFLVFMGPSVSGGNRMWKNKNRTTFTLDSSLHWQNTHDRNLIKFGNIDKKTFSLCIYYHRVILWLKPMWPVLEKLVKLECKRSKNSFSHN